jgi:hypothetical protein
MPIKIIRDTYAAYVRLIIHLYIREHRIEQVRRIGYCTQDGNDILPLRADAAVFSVNDWYIIGVWQPGRR